MKKTSSTNIKVKKFLNVYSLITILLFIILISLINFSNLNGKANAEQINCCFGGCEETADGYQCYDCQASPCFGLVCEYPEVTLCRCHDYTGGEDAGYCDCVNWYDQHIWCNYGMCLPGSENDPYCEPPECPDGWETCGTSRECSGGRCPECEIKSSTTCYCENCSNPTYVYRYCKKGDVPPPPPDVCPYASTQARVQEDREHHWQPVIILQEGDSFRIGSFHSNSGLFADDTYLEVTGPDGYFYSCDGSTVDGDCNGYTISNVVEGTYILAVNTYNNEGKFYPEIECNDTAKAIIEVEPPPPPPERGFEIEKNVRNGIHYYDVGDAIIFDIEISNIGEVVIEEMLYIDRYDSSYLRFEDINGRRERNGDLIEQDNLLDYIDPSDPNGEFRIDDLTKYLGDLGIDEKFVLEVEFTAIKETRNNQIWNVAIADDSIDQKEDRDWVIIRPIEEPPTDR